MPIHPGLEGVLLDVAYRGSSEPQLDDVGVKLGGAAELPLAPWAIGSLLECINHGLAGGAEFPPEAGWAKLEAGCRGEGPPSAMEHGPAYVFRIAVAGMSPRFLRVFVEHLAMSGNPHPVKTISIVGALPTDGSAASVRENQLGSWLEDPSAYPAAWASPGFRVVPRSVPRGASVRVTLAGGRIDDVATELEETISSWQNAVLTYPNLQSTSRGVMAPHASFARTRTELYAKLALFDHARAPARDALVNALARFHAKIAPLASVEIGLP